MDDTSPVVLIAGVTGGIGSVLARKLHAAGWRVAGFARDLGRLGTLSGELSGADLCAAEATDPEAVERVVQGVVERHGRLDAYVHAVGTILVKNAQQTTVEEWRSTLDANLNSAFYGLKHAIAPIQRQGGSLVFVSSVAARTGLASHEAVGAAKAGIEGMVRSAAASYASRNVRVNAVAPGLVDTPLARPLLGSEAARAFSEKLHPLGRVGRPENVAGVIAWLLSEEGSWVTGEVWSVDGGMANVRPRPKV